jgi:hypothetical protein
MRNLNQVINDAGLARAEWGSEAAIRLAPALSKLGASRRCDKNSASLTFSY